MKKKIFPIIVSIVFSCFFAFSGIVYAADTWEDVTPPAATSTITTVASMGDYIYVGTANGIYKSANAGQSWTAVNTGLTNLYITSIAIGWVFDGSAYVVDSSSPVFVGTQNGIFKSTIGGTTWTAVNTGLTNTIIHDIEIDQYQAAAEGAFTNVYAATEVGVFLSTNQGSSWTLINSGMTNLPVQKLTSDFNGYIYALSSTSSTSRIFANSLFSVSGSNDAWTQTYSETGTTTNDITMLNPVGLINWVATNKGIIKSEDNGMDWKVRNTGLTSLNVSTVVSDYADPNIAYAAVPGEGVYRTTVEPLDSLNWRWKPINQGLTDLQIEEVKTNPGNSQLVYAMSEDGVYKLELSDMYIDLTNPSTISDLEVTTNNTQIILNWSAPGNDGIYGTTTSYAVRYATSAITDGNWTSATLLAGQPTPSGYGSEETFIITSLSTTTSYYFAVKSIDDDGNESELSNVVVSAVDTTAPVITGPNVSSISSSGATISWSSNESATFRVLYGTASGSYSQTSTSATLNSTHSVSLTSLGSNTTYYYVVELTDAQGNTSTSSQSTFTTSTTVSSGGGGKGGSSSSSSRSSSSSSSSSTTVNPSAVTTTEPTEAQLLAIIKSLIAQIEAIKKQRGVTSPTVSFPTSTAGSGVITRDLELNSEGEDVRTLQKYLNTHGYIIAASGDGSPGNETTFFGPATRAALIRFQLAKGITPAEGYFGAKSKIAMGLSTSVAPSTNYVPSVTPTFTVPLTRDLELNSEGEDVRALQKYLNSNGFIIAAFGDGSPGNETTFFGPATQKALIAFQKSKGIVPSAGYFGPKTKALTGL